MKIGNNIELEALTPEDYYKKADEFYAAGDINGFLEFQRTHSILYVDPISEQDKEFLKDIDIPKVPEDFNIGSL